MFGGYTSKLLKEISSLLKVLERGNLHIVDLAKQLAHFSSFEGPSLQKAKQSYDSDRKQFEQKREVVQGAIMRAKEEVRLFMAEHSLISGYIEKSISNNVFSLPERISEVVGKIKGCPLRIYLDHFYHMSNYLNSSKDHPQRLPHLEFLYEQGDGLKSDFVSGYHGKARHAFDYTKYLNNKGFFKTTITEKPSPLPDRNSAIEEVVDLSTDYSKWQIVDQNAEVDLSQQQELSVMLDQEFRDGLNSELEEVLCAQA